MKRFIAGLLMSGLMIPQLGAIVPPSCFNDSHDITSLILGTLFKALCRNFAYT